jgi:hypothetical protein
MLLADGTPNIGRFPDNFAFNVVQLTDAIEGFSRYRGFVRFPDVVEVTPPMGEAGSFPEARFAVRAGLIEVAW